MTVMESIEKLKDQIDKLLPKKQEILSRWISVWADYLKFESSFEPERLMEYRRGDIVHAHLGVNVGNEEGGARYAVVIDKSNPRTSKVITVIPLSTLDEKKGRGDLRSTDVYFGEDDSRLRSGGVCPRTLHQEHFKNQDYSSKSCFPRRIPLIGRADAKHRRKDEGIVFLNIWISG